MTRATSRDVHDPEACTSCSSGACRRCPFCQATRRQLIGALLHP